MTEVTDYAWPTDLPENCPPGDAQPAEGTFFRFVKDDPPSRRDFVRPIDLPGASARHGPDERCEASALSLFADQEDVQKARALIPGFGKKKVARGELAPHMGVLKHTAPPIAEQPVFESHHDWWMPSTYSDLPPFVVVTT
jgi:hypothetical protein